MFTIIAAIGEDNELGTNGRLIWDLPKDLQFFKEKTLKHKIVMGSKTYDSMPKHLPEREYFVLTRNQTSLEGATIISDVSRYIEENKDTEEEIFIIGGGQVYNTFLPHCNKMYLTQICKTYLDADTYFPDFCPEDWLVSTIDEISENGIGYSHLLYIRK